MRDHSSKDGFNLEIWQMFYVTDHLWSFGRSRKFGLWLSLRHATVHNPLKLEKKYIDMFTERSNKNQERLPYDDILVFKDIVGIFLDKSAVISYHYIHEILLLYFVLYIE